MELQCRFLGICCLVSMCLSQSADIQGIKQKCNNEGMPAKIDDSFPCFTCHCKNGYIECQKKRCPKTEDCFNPSTKHNDSCCPSQCKGCWYNGSYHYSGTTWIADANDPCLMLTCVHRVITESRITCYTPCSAPLPPLPGQCCPRCPACSLRGQSMGAGTELRPYEDPCLTCVCDTNGFMTCTKSACPVVSCSTRQRAGQCCHRCIQGSMSSPLSPPRRKPTMMDPPRGVCLMGTLLLKSQQQSIDSCNRCRCLQGGRDPTVYCVATTCQPLIDCPIERQRYLTSADCCKSCPPAEEVGYVSSKCVVKGVTYKDGDSWQLSPCASCQCEQGVSKCAHVDCAMSTVGAAAPTNGGCPRNFKLTKLPGKCCPECVEKDGRCMVFGGHFRTFDESHFSFHSDCKYQLALDCSTNHTFAVRMSTANPVAGKKSANFKGYRPKLITVRLGNHKVTMGQKMKTKVDGVRVTIPHRLDKILEITKQRDSIVLSTSIGLKVMWNGQSLIEIHAPPTMKSHLCGLCGNYNGRSGDDLVDRRGETVYEPEKFAQAWRIGGAKSCSGGIDRYFSTSEYCPADTKKQNRGYRKCAQIRNDVFQVCDSIVPVTRYYKACISESCRCPSRKRCHCEVFEAYIRECRALSTNVTPSIENTWRHSTGCYQQSKGSEHQMSNQHHNS